MVPTFKKFRLPPSSYDSSSVVMSEGGFKNFRPAPPMFHCRSPPWLGYTAAELPHKPKNFCCCQIIVSFSPSTKKYCLQKILPEAHFCSHTYSDSPKIPSSFLSMLIAMLTLKSIQNIASKIRDISKCTI